MKIFTTSDIHGNQVLIYLLRRIIEKEDVDALIIAGDITPKGFYRLFDNAISYGFYSPFNLKNRETVLDGKSEQVKAKSDILGFVEAPRSGCNVSALKTKQKEKLRQMCELLKTMNIPVYMLIGNDDHISDEDWCMILDDYGVFNLNSRTHRLKGLNISGFQYVLPTPWNTNNELPEDKLAQELRKIENQVDKNTVFVTHGPPKGVLDRITNGLQVGSVSILDLVKDKQPIFHVFGHIHEAFGWAKIGNTICCNTSCLWTDWLLRGYIIDTEKISIKKIEEEVPLEEINVLSFMNRDSDYVC